MNGSTGPSIIPTKPDQPASYSFSLQVVFLYGRFFELSSIFVKYWYLWRELTIFLSILFSFNFYRNFLGATFWKIFEDAFFLGCWVTKGVAQNSGEKKNKPEKVQSQNPRSGTAGEGT